MIISAVKQYKGTGRETDRGRRVVVRERKAEGDTLKNERADS